MRLLVLELSARCDQACLHCTIWTGRAGAGSTLDRAARLRAVDEALAAGAREALLTGGEPLLSPDLWPVAEHLKARGARVLLATNGMGLERGAADVARLVDEVYVSLDGADAATHDRQRGAASLARLAAGLSALRAQVRRPRVVARSVVSAANADDLPGIVAAARRLGADHVSFLPLDAASDAFGAGDRRPLLPSADQRRRLYAAIERLQSEGTLGDGFVLEDAAKLRRLVHHLAASAGAAAFARPRCNAPRWSAVITADGRLKPCFFHPPVGEVSDGLRRRLKSREYQRAIRATEAPNDTCARCVCPKWRGPWWRGLFA